MKTTLVVADSLMARLRREAARRGCTPSELVEAALRLLLDRRPPTRRLPPLPRFDGGGALVDIADHGALNQSMGDR